jgi:hypothetical protein
VDYRSAGEWTKKDLLFLRHQLQHGMSVEQLACFLNKTTDEVRAKAKELDEGSSSSR